MKLLFLSLFILSCSHSQNKIYVQRLPELKYISAQNTKYDHQSLQHKDAQIKAHHLIESLVKVANEQKLKRPFVHFFRLDLSSNVILDACLETPEVTSDRLGPYTIKKRPEGNYLFFEAKNMPHNDEIKSQLFAYIKEHSLKLKNGDTFFYKKTAIPSDERSIIIFPLE